MKKQNWFQQHLYLLAIVASLPFGLGAIIVAPILLGLAFIAKQTWLKEDNKELVKLLENDKKKVVVKLPPTKKDNTLKSIYITGIVLLICIFIFIKLVNLGSN